MKQRNNLQRILLVIAASFIMAANIKIFVRAGDMFPGGFNGLTLLIQRTASRYFDLDLPFSVINLILNAVPAVISFLYIGKKFTLYSGLMILLSSVLTDILPSLADHLRSSSDQYFWWHHQRLRHQPLPFRPCNQRGNRFYRYLLL